MEKNDLYDKYINNLLPEKERIDFDARLESDKEFASDFKVYLFTIDGICREAHQNNLDFGLAMKNLSKEKLKEIIGKHDSERPVVASVAETPQKFFNSNLGCGKLHLLLQLSLLLLL